MDSKLGQVGLTTEAKSFVQHMIEWVTRAQVHHVVIAISETECIGARPGGARIDKIDYRKDIIWSQFDLTPEQAQNCADWARVREGRPYSFINGFLIGVHCLFGIKFPDWITEQWSDDDSYHCSGFADSALTDGAGIDVFTDGRLHGAVAPVSWEKLFKRRGWWSWPTR